MILFVIPCGPIQANCYILADDATRNCIIIDPGDAASVLKVIKEKDLFPAKIILTHGHFDHCMGVEALLQATDAEVWMHKEDEELVDGSSSFVSAQRYGLTPFIPSHYFDNNDLVIQDSIQLRVLHTPGHSKGSVCFIDDADNIVFSGDTMFYESIGRTDLHGGSMNALLHSVFDILFQLPDMYKVLPGHGEPTSIKHEKCFNPLVQYENYYRQEIS